MPWTDGHIVRSRAREGVGSESTVVNRTQVAHDERVLPGGAKGTRTPALTR
jgi:hypothetical protein